MSEKKGIHKLLFLGVAALVVIVLGLAACGGGDDSATPAGGGGGLLPLEGNPGAVPEQTSGTRGDLADLADHPELCGDEEITVALADGFGGNAWRVVQLAEFEAEAAKCPNIVEVLYTDAQGEPQKSLSDIRGLIASGVDVIVTYADTGEAILPAVKEATEAGVSFIPHTEVIGGEIGVDYPASVYATEQMLFDFGVAYAEWMVKATGGEGGIVQLGGPPGVPYSAHINEGILSIFEQNPGLSLLEGPVATDWDVGKCQQVMSGLLTKYDQIDGVISDYGECAVAATRAFEAAERPLPPFTGDDQNALACTYEEKRDANPNFEIAIGESRVWAARAALRRGLAALNRVELDEPTVLGYSLVADSIAGGDMAPACNPDLPPSAFTASSMLTNEEIVEIFGEG